MLSGPVFLHILPVPVHPKFVSAFKVNMTLKTLRPVRYLEFNSQSHWKVKSTLIFLKRCNDIYFFVRVCV
jgi:hypothetical protein